ncbi:MAG: hypothetical protein ACNS63_07255 [Candidatus Nitrospinota bacterium M3_3B_026]
MDHKKFAAALAALALVTGLNAWAWTEQDKDGEKEKLTRIRGIGQKTCSSYLEDAEKEEKGGYALYEAWVEGYLSSYSVFVPDTAIVDSKDTKILMWWLKKYCALRKKDKFSQAIRAMLYELAPERAPHRVIPGM